LARAIALDPQIVFYDEPFAGLDPISMGVIARLIQTLNQALNMTSIVVSHDVQETFLIADEIYLLMNGEIIMHGSPEALKNSSNPYVQQFVNAKADGPVAFHQPAKPLYLDFMMPK
jgi:phospholipid/cholesterol/gamma-HCH transport system ATP-binding protein